MSTNSIIRGRQIRYAPFRGSKAEAQTLLGDRLSSVDRNACVEPNKILIVDHVRRRIDAFETATEPITARSRRSRQLLANQIGSLSRRLAAATFSWTPR